MVDGKWDRDLAYERHDSPIREVPVYNHKKVYDREGKILGKHAIWFDRQEPYMSWQELELPVEPYGKEKPEAYRLKNPGDESRYHTKKREVDERAKELAGNKTRKASA